MDESLSRFAVYSVGGEGERGLGASYNIVRMRFDLADSGTAREDRSSVHPATVPRCLGNGSPVCNLSWLGPVAAQVRLKNNGT